VSNKNKHNSIVFLTTLSVYLGLVLIGAPPILAQAALTRNFDIQNEIEFKDNLDKKPNDEEVENSSKEDFPSLFAQLLNEIKEDVGSGKIALSIKTNFRFEAYFNYSEMCNGSGFGSEPSADKHLAKIVEDAFRQKIEPTTFELADYPTTSAKNIKLNLEANRTNLSLKISFGKFNAEQFAEFLNKKWSLSAISVEDTLTKQIYENTKATSENNQVFIVTRLPRGSLDELLNNAKAESK
jgi:hypothetical protein